jgi:hypothetical protein
MKMVKNIFLKIYCYGYKKAIERHDPVSPKSALVKELLLNFIKLVIRYFKTH